MRLVSLGEKMLRNHTPITMPVPISPFDANLWYRIVNKSSGLALNSTFTLSSNSVSNANLQWQLAYDDAGHYNIKNRASGKVIQNDEAVSETAKWELVWDGSGCCKIKDTASGKMLSSGNAATNDAPVLQAGDANSDDLRWQIQIQN
jgi:hypothetical protein